MFLRRTEPSEASASSATGVAATGAGAATTGATLAFFSAFFSGAGVATTAGAAAGADFFVFEAEALIMTGTEEVAEDMERE